MKAHDYNLDVFIDNLKLKNRIIIVDCLPIETCICKPLFLSSNKVNGFQTMSINRKR
jgi:hypothetical protein